jgi:hypothetical protein
MSEQIEEERKTPRSQRKNESDPYEESKSPQILPGDEGKEKI